MVIVVGNGTAGEFSMQCMLPCWYWIAYNVLEWPLARPCHTGLTLGISHALPGGVATAAGGQSACSLGLLGPVTVTDKASKEVKYGCRLILTTGWMSVREFELRRCPHAVATSSRVRHRSPWRMRVKIGPVGLSGCSPLTHKITWQSISSLLN